MTGGPQGEGCDRLGPPGAGTGGRSQGLRPAGGAKGCDRQGDFQNDTIFPILVGAHCGPFLCGTIRDRGKEPAGSGLQGHGPGRMRIGYIFWTGGRFMDPSYSKRISTAGLLITLGIIYGDIGTSPLYTFQTIMTEGGRVSQELVLGAISCVFWTLTLQTTFKYVFITLKADNRGEGGVFSLYALVRRYGKVLVYPAIIGAGTLLADGIITPPITVTSAIEGLNMVHGMENAIVPGNNLVVEVVLVIILMLFVFQ